MLVRIIGGALVLIVLAAVVFFTEASDSQGAPQPQSTFSQPTDNSFKDLKIN